MFNPLQLFNRKNTQLLHNNNQIMIRQSIIHGLGVFATTVFTKNELIEKAPIILGSKKDYLFIEHTVLHDYYFLTKSNTNPFVIGLGLASFYNHSSSANAYYRINIYEQSISFFAAKHIITNDEITINYNGKPEDKNPIIFTTNTIN
jgi:uncharacterized protein